MAYHRAQRIHFADGENMALFMLEISSAASPRWRGRYRHHWQFDDVKLELYLFIFTRKYTSMSSSRSHWRKINYQTGFIYRAMPRRIFIIQRRVGIVARENNRLYHFVMLRRRWPRYRQPKASGRDDTCYKKSICQLSKAWQLSIM